VKDVNKVLVAAELVDLAQYHVVNRAGDLVDAAAGALSDDLDTGRRLP